MKFSKNSPRHTLKWEPQRRQLLSKLRVVYELYGLKTIGGILINSAVQNHKMEDWRRGRSSIYQALRNLGIIVHRMQGREFRVTDIVGTFYFEDDIYFSGLHNICRPLLKLGFAFPEQLPADREPRSFGKSLLEIRDYLADLHVKELYGNDLKFKLLGGDFSGYRLVEYGGGEVTVRPNGHRVNREPDSLHRFNDVKWEVGVKDILEIINNIDDPSREELKYIIELVIHHTGFRSLHDHIVTMVDPIRAAKLFVKGRYPVPYNLDMVCDKALARGFTPRETVAACVRRRNLILRWKPETDPGDRKRKI